MEKNLDEITAMVMADQIFGLAIDTCTFSQHKNRLESGWFARLAQFHLGSTRVYLPQIVKSEVLSHIAEESELALSNLKSAASKVRKMWNLDFSIDIEELTVAPLEMAARRFKKFEERTSAVIVPICTNVEKIFDDYFSSSPPFEKKESKKHEFPDSFALHSLVELCQTKNKTLLVVSSDKGWKSFCKNHPMLVCIDDLGKALSCFQNENALFAAKLLSSDFATNRLAHMSMQIEHHFGQAIRDCEVELDAESASTFRLEYQFIELDIRSFKIDLNGEQTFAALEYTGSELTVQCSASVSLQAVFEISYYLWDMEDLQEWRLTSETKKFSSEQSFDLLISIDLPNFRDFIPAEAAVSAVEINDKTIYFKGGQLEPYFGPPSY